MQLLKITTFILFYFCVRIAFSAMDITFEPSVRYNNKVTYISE
jgi:hypothetical protein